MIDLEPDIPDAEGDMDLVPAGSKGFGLGFRVYKVSGLEVFGLGSGSLFLLDSGSFFQTFSDLRAEPYC